MTSRWVIYKYELSKSGETIVVAPIGSQVLSVQNQREKLVLWMRCYPQDELTNWKFISHLTGEFVASVPGEFIGTAQFDGGQFICHVFRVRE